MSSVTLVQNEIGSELRYGVSCPPATYHIVRVVDRVTGLLEYLGYRAERMGATISHGRVADPEEPGVAAYNIVLRVKEKDYDRLLALWQELADDIQQKYPDLIQLFYLTVEQDAD